MTREHAHTARLILVLLLGLFLLLFPASLPPGAGDRDLQAYWSSAYLLAQGQDFSDPVRLGEIERTLTTHDSPETLFAWFSPIGNVVLLPLTWIPFSRAAWYWLIFNIAVLFSSVLLLWESSRSRIWIPLLAAFSFSMSVFSLIFGQINFLELLGLALFLSLSRSNRPYLAGAGLALTTIKPHLVLLTLPILVLDLFQKREWKVLTGFAAALLFCAGVLSALYPPWIKSSWAVVASGMSNFRETPTLNGLLVITGIQGAGKWTWLLALLAGIFWWWKRGETWDQRRFIDLSLTVGLIVSPIGWSYDQIMLLFPILTLLAWVAEGRLSKTISITVVLTLVLMNVLAYLLRIPSPSDVWFFWLPFVVLGLYLLALQDLQKTADPLPAIRSTGA